MVKRPAYGRQVYPFNTNEFIKNICDKKLASAYWLVSETKSTDIEKCDNLF